MKSGTGIKSLPDRPVSMDQLPPQFVEWMMDKNILVHAATVLNGRPTAIALHSRIPLNSSQPKWIQGLIAWLEKKTTPQFAGSSEGLSPQKSKPTISQINAELLSLAIDELTPLQAARVLERWELVRDQRNWYYRK